MHLQYLQPDPPQTDPIEPNAAETPEIVQQDVSRRSFLKSSALVGGSLVVGFFVPAPLRRMAFAQEQPAAQAVKAPLPPVNAFLRIGSDESVTVILAHSEMGQGIWTTLPMMVNEELEADWSRIRVEHAPTAPVYISPIFPIQMTGGSTTTWSELDRYRQVGAVARTLLVAAAAKQWGVAPGDCRVENGFVISGGDGGKRASYGSLAAAAAKLPQPEHVELKTPENWKIIGKPTRRLDTPEKITGRAKFGMDVQLPGMLTAVVAHGNFGAKVKSFDATAAKALPGVRAVFEVPMGVAVVGEHFWAAKCGRDALKVTWDPGPHAGLDTANLRASFLEQSKTAGAKAAANGDVAKILAAEAPNGSTPPLVAEYSLPYLAHAPMEPLNCTVRHSPGRCEVWTGTQFQTVDQQRVAAIFGLKPEHVEIHTTFLGGGFGRRANIASDFVVEAAHVAKKLDKPVKLVWSREDDIRGGYYRPMAIHRVEGALDPHGVPVAWRHRIVSQSIMAGSLFAAMIQNGIDPTVVEGASDSPYVKAIPHHLIEQHTPTPGVPVLWWRSVGNSHTAFAVESFVDELAYAAKRDPLEFRRAMLAKSPRFLAVLELAAEKAGWGTPPPAGRARGLAVHESFGSIVSHVAEVSVDQGRIRVHRVTCAIDCGVCVNPLGVRAQMESGVAFGLGAALYSELTMKEGRVLESNFHDYRILRLHEMPQVDVHIMPSHEKSGGAGEPGTPPIAPAVANAVFALTGKRLRDLPLRLA
ncbi:MAG TPA: xanthine dehydrogenase family protein molybdopterin-binding subunit [Thermoanaerobaculia bacterium]|jgi:isoquinoline 1-oxidoreductase beta subunit|nr:xanthine dehydrogenase family protein molybdopterin-binding subunit [Thermoanaerobaculia bacterium]